MTKRSSPLSSKPAKGAASAKGEGSDVAPGNPMANFKRLAKGVVAVSREDLAREEAKWERAQVEKRRKDTR